MLNKRFAFLIVLSLLSKSHADNYPDNLKNLSFEDMCPMDIYVRIDSQESKEDIVRLKKLISDQDILFNTSFTRSSYDKCTIGSFISIEAFKTSSGSYSYNYDLVIGTSAATIQLYDRNVSVKYISFYDYGGFGVSASLSSFKTRLDDIVKNSFQDFVLAWRKVH